MKPLHLALSAVAAALVAAPLSAQTPAPASGTTIKHSCVKPDEFPGRLATDQKMRSWQKAFLSYSDCLKKFIADEQAAAEPHIKAGNAAIQEYNAAIKDYNSAVESTKENANQDTKGPGY
jgi:hypothetical protein